MPEKLPKGWIKTTLGEITEPSRERALPIEVPDMRYVGLEHIEPQTMRLLGHIHARDVRSSSVRFLRGDVLYGKMRPYLNKVWVADFDGLCSAEFLVFRQIKGLNNQFLALRMNAEDFVKFANGQVSGERPRIDFDKLSHFPILLPPIAEQERIAAKLTETLSATERANIAAYRAQERLKHYRSAVIDAGVAGRLTTTGRKAQQKKKSAAAETGEILLQRLLEERRNRWYEVELQRLRAIGKAPENEKWKSRYPDPTPPMVASLPNLPEGWTWASPKQLSSGDNHSLAIGPFGSNLKVSDYRDSGVPIIFVRNIRSGIFSGDIMHFVTHKKADELKAHQVKGGDILITKMGDPPGYACLYPESAPNAIITADCIRFQLSALLEKPKPFLVYAINSKLGRDQILQVTKGVVQQKVSLSRFSAIALPLPPLVEQIKIVSEVERRLSAADRLDEALEQQLSRSHIVRQLLLNRAFAGKLVPQDSKDEPATILLEQIHVAREIEAKKLKVKPMPKSKSKLVRRSLLDVLFEHKQPMTPEQLFKDSGYQQEFESNEYRQEVVDSFYEELRQIVGPAGPVLERRSDLNNKILLEVKP